MSDQVAFTLGVGLEAKIDLEALKNSLNVMQHTIQAVPDMKLGIQFEDMKFDTTKADQLLDSLREQVTSIDDITVKTQEMRNAVGDSWQEITQLVVKYTDAQGNSATAIIHVDDNLKSLAKHITTYQNLAKRAEDWGNKAEKMSGKEAQAIKKTSVALKEKIALFNQAIAEGRIKDAQNLTREIDNLAIVFEKDVSATKRAATALQDWSSSIGRAIKQTISYTFSIGMMRQAQKMLNDAIRFTIDLNTEMTKIQVLQAEGAQSPEEIRELAKSYNQLAKELGATTKEIAEGSVEWLRQGKTVEETGQLMRASTMMAKLGNTTLAEATELLTSTMNGFKMSTEEAIVVVDKLVHIDNIAATSTKELATALRYVAAVAYESGVTFDQLISYVAVLSETTRLNAEQIGQALKTIFTRMQDIQAGKLDEEGMGLNNVESALARINVRLRDTPTSFRDLSIVLEEVASKWSTLNDVEQANIAKSIAGVRQQNMFRILMSEMSSVLEYQTEAYEALGTATERYEIYLESIEAKQAQLKASIESLYMDAIQDGFIKSLYDIIIWVTKAIREIGGLRTVVVSLGIAFLALKWPMIIGLFKDLIYVVKAVTTATITLTEVTVAYQAAATMGISLIIAAVVALGWAISKLIVTTKESDERIKDLNRSISESSRNVTRIKELSNQYDNLKKEIKHLKEGTIEYNQASESLVRIQNELGELLPQIVVGIDEYGNKIIDTTKSVEELTEATLAQIKADEAALKVEYERNAYVRGFKLNVARGRAEKSQNIASQIGATPKQIAKAKQDWADYLVMLETEIPKFTKMGELGRALFLEGLVEGLDEELANELREIFEKTARDASESAREEWRKQAYKERQQKKRDAEEETRQAVEIARERARESAIAYQREILGMSEEEIKEIWRTWLPSEELFMEIVPSIQKGVDNLATVFKTISQEELVTKEQLDKLEALNITLDITNEGFQQLYYTQADGTKIAISSIEEYVKIVLDLLEAEHKLEPGMRAATEAFLLNKYAVEETSDAIKKLQGEYDVLTSAISEWNKNGILSEETAIKLIMANEELEGYLKDTGNGFLFSADAAYADSLAKLENTLQTLYLKTENINLREAAIAAGDGNLYLAATHIKAARLAEEQEKALLSLISTMSKLKVAFYTPASVSGAKGDSPQVKALEAEIKAREENIKAIEREIRKLEDRKKGLKAQLDQFKKWIDAQKESLRLAKEEEDFRKRMEKKQQSLAKIRTKIDLLALDNSEWAQAERLRLEEEAAKLEEEIREDTEDRKYDLQIEALDRVLKAFEEQINAQMAAIDKLIQAHQDEIAIIRDVISAIRDQISEIKKAESGVGELQQGIEQFGEKSVEEINKVKEELLKLFDTMTQGSAAQRQQLAGMISQWQALGLTVAQVQAMAMVAMNLMAQFGAIPLIDPDTGAYIRTHGGDYAYHTGGIVEEHHEGNSFAGQLRSNEVFAKLLSGEYVATENQMDNFMKNILPKIIDYPNENSIVNNSSKTGDVVFETTINVEGSVDKDVIPDLKKVISSTMLELMEKRGMRRNAHSFSL